MCTLEREKYISLMYIVYANTSYNTPYYTHVSSYLVWRVHPQDAQSKSGVTFEPLLFELHTTINIGFLFFIFYFYLVLLSCCELIY